MYGCRVFSQWDRIYFVLPQHNSHSRDGRDLSNSDTFFMLREIDHDPHTV